MKLDIGVVAVFILAAFTAEAGLQPARTARVMHTAADWLNPPPPPPAQTEFGCECKLEGTRDNLAWETLIGPPASMYEEQSLVAPSGAARGPPHQLRSHQGAPVGTTTDCSF